MSNSIQNTTTNSPRVPSTIALTSRRITKIVKSGREVNECRWTEDLVVRKQVEVVAPTELVGIDIDYRIDGTRVRPAVLVLIVARIRILVCTSGIKRLSVRCDGGGIQVILVIVELIELLARACQSLLLRFSQYMLLCRLISCVSITYHVFLRWSWSSSLVQGHSTAVAAMSLLDIGQVGCLHWLKGRWCRILSSMLSLAIVKVISRIGQHYECSRSSEKSLLSKVMQLSTPVVPRLCRLAYALAIEFQNHIVPHAAQAVRPGRLRSSVFSADVDSEEPWGNVWRRPQPWKFS